MMENAINWNWSDAIQNAEEFWFYAADLIRMFENIGEDYWYDVKDLIYIAEGAAELRGNKK